MKICDPHVHMTSRTTDDYASMAAAGLTVVVEPASWLGQPRRHVGSFEDAFATLCGWERHRAAGFGVRHHCALALNPREANDPAVAQGVLDLLPRYLVKDGVVAVGEIGFDDGTAEEELAVLMQLELALRHDLPVVVQAPPRDTRRGVARSLDLLREAGFPEPRALIDGNSEETLPLVLRTRCWAGLSMNPGHSTSRMDEDRIVAAVRRFGSERLLVGSGADFLPSDPLKVPRTVERLRASGVDESAVEAIVWSNPIAFFGQSGRLEV